jgi:hypothetical protein
VLTLDDKAYDALTACKIYEADCAKITYEAVEANDELATDRELVCEVSTYPDTYEAVSALTAYDDESINPLNEPEKDPVPTKVIPS